MWLRDLVRARGENCQRLETKLKKPESCRCNAGEHSEVPEKCRRRNASRGGTLDGRKVGGDHKQKALEMEYIYITSGIKLRPHTNNK